VIVNEDAEQCEGCGRVPRLICDECGCCARHCECEVEEYEEGEPEDEFERRQRG